MPEKLKDNSTSDDLLGFGFQPADEEGTELQRDLRCSRRRRHLRILLPLLLLCSLAAAGLVLLAWRLSPSRTLHVTMVIDANATRQCEKSIGSSQLPCMRKGIYITSKEPLGPLRCHDDAAAVDDNNNQQQQQSSSSSCYSSPFRLSHDGRGVVIPETGTYQLFARVTFHEKVTEGMYASVNVRIDPDGLPQCRGSHSCMELRESRSHTWLTCLTVPSAGAGRRPHACAVAGVRRLRRGDTVGLQVTDQYRCVNSFVKLTYFYLIRL